MRIEGTITAQHLFINGTDKMMPPNQPVQQAEQSPSQDNTSTH